jgi:hypothetical protein
MLDRRLAAEESPMDADRFDALARALRQSRSRRSLAAVGLAGLLASGSEATEAEKTCPFCKRRKRDKCKPDRGKDGLPCGEQKVCNGGRCVGLDATCPAAADQCDGTQTSCGPRGSRCVCFQRIDGGGVLCAEFSRCLATACTATTGCLTGEVCIAAAGPACPPLSCPTSTACATPCRID